LTDELRAGRRLVRDHGHSLLSGREEARCILLGRLLTLLAERCAVRGMFDSSLFTKCPRATTTKVHFKRGGRKRSHVLNSIQHHKPLFPFLFLNGIRVGEDATSAWPNLALEGPEGTLLASKDKMPRLSSSKGSTLKALTATKASAMLPAARGSLVPRPAP